MFIAITWVVSWFAEKHVHEVVVETVALLSFLTIFSFQRSQNKETKALQLKLDELLASSENASNRLIKAEEAPESVLDQVHEIYRDVAIAAIDEDSSKRRLAINHAESVLEEMYAEAASQTDMCPPSQTDSLE
ncbi:hypothetical protein BH10CYA1_BH10CYA1_59280 [soil metagenome]